MLRVRQTRSHVFEIVVFLVLAFSAPPIKGLVLIRTSILESWDSKAPRSIIGWIREERDESKQTLQVRIGLERDHNEGITSSSKPSSDILSIALPFMVDESSLGSTLWSSGQAMAILGRTSAFRSIVQGKQIIEVGAGLGLPGRVLATQGARSVLLTDNDQDIFEQQRPSANTDQDRSSSHLTSRLLDWRDSNSDANSDMRESFDVIVGSDVAYYFYLLRPLMDTIQTVRKPLSSTCIIAGQANRKSQWDLYHNIRKGCYNQITDQHEGPWTGRTQMLLYRLRMGEWQQETKNDSDTNNSDDVNQMLEQHLAELTKNTNALTGVVPIAVLWHEVQENESEHFQQGLTSVDYVATRSDEDALEMTF
ncbi:hypothetical protein ACA910_005241 [Epithemia clementina (nom. ined.)]